MNTSLFPDLDTQSGERYRPKTKNNYYLDEVRSAIQKEIRRGKVREAFFWAFELYDSGMWRYLVRTLVTIAGEDIGMANPQAMTMCMTAYRYFTDLAKERGEKKKTVCKHCGAVEITKGYYQPNPDEIGFLVAYLALSPKNRFVDEMIRLTDEQRKLGLRLKIPDYAIDSHTVSGKKRNKENNINPDVEFYNSGALLENYQSFDLDTEKKVHENLMHLLNLD